MPYEGSAACGSRCSLVTRDSCEVPVCVSVLPKISRLGSEGRSVV